MSGVGLVRWDITPVPLKMFRMEIWIRLLITLVKSLVGGSRPALLGSRVLEIGLSMIYSCLQRKLHNR